MRRAVQWLLLSGLLLCLPFAQAREAQGVSSGISPAQLPSEGRDTLRLIRQGGPFPYARDGIVFKNREAILPSRPRGHYHEYTVPTPGVRHRGARRIVCGASERATAWQRQGRISEPAALEGCYYSGDHYRSFQRIQE